MIYGEVLFFQWYQLSVSVRDFVNALVKDIGTRRVITISQFLSFQGLAQVNTVPWEYKLGGPFLFLNPLGGGIWWSHIC